ncbi:class I SAM-dependent methyltransferase [Lysinibacillus sp. KU-BSD001]|uniref:class I SAM-dependent methyltransferase n=1 Tax=Lysinibacillus sp. KU-BSD001 TaxID=3141328 RepID=UPI0036EBC6D4
MKYNYQINIKANNSHAAILKKIQPNSKVLEFGPATGYMTEYMKHELNCSIYAVEVDSEAASIAEKFTDKMVVCDVETLEWVEQFKNQTFDFIIFADVLEHLRDPWRILRIVKDFLKPNGQLLISIPNIAHNAVLIELLGGKFKYRKLGLLDNTHLRFFTKSSTIELIEQSGLYIDDIQKVIIPPEVTELNTTYQGLPYSVADFLRSRKDGNVYQYVITATKIEASTKKKISDDKQEVIYIASDYVELFYDLGNGFNENDVIKLPIKEVGELVTYKYQLPSLPIKAIRLDPSNSPGVGMISNFELRYLEKNVSINLLKEMKPLNELSLLEMKDSQFIFLSLNNDPQIKIELPNYLKEDNIEIIISLSFSKFYDHKQSELLKYYFKENETRYLNTLSESNNKLNELENDWNLLLMKNDELEKTNKLLSNKIQECMSRNDYLNIELEKVQAIKNDLEKEYYKLINSFYWKITEPLRVIKKIFKFKR